MVIPQTQSMQIMIDETIKKLEKAFEELEEYFGKNTIDSPLYTDCPWMFSGYTDSDIRFAYPGTKVEKYDDLDYSNEIIGTPIVKDEYTAIYVNNGCGDQYWMILKNSNRRKDIEKQNA